MSVSYTNGLQMLTELNHHMVAPYAPNELFQFDLDDGSSCQFANTAYLIEFLVARADKVSWLKAKIIARLLETLLREGDAQLVNSVLVETVETFSFQGKRPNVRTIDIASVMPETLRKAYLEEMGELQADKAIQTSKGCDRSRLVSLVKSLSSNRKDGHNGGNNVYYRDRINYTQHSLEHLLRAFETRAIDHVIQRERQKTFVCQSHIEQGAHLIRCLRNITATIALMAPGEMFLFRRAFHAIHLLHKGLRHSSPKRYPSHALSKKMLFNKGLKLLSDLLRNTPVRDATSLFQFNREESVYMQLWNAAYLIEFLAAQAEKESRLNAKRVARLLDTFLREGDERLINGVLVGTLEAFTLPSELSGLTVQTIAKVMPPTLRTAYLKEMGEIETA